MQGPTYAQPSAHKVQGCSFAQTTWGSKMLTALNLSRYPPNSTYLFLTFRDASVRVFINV